MKRLDLVRFALTWILGYVLIDRILPVDSWILRFFITGSIVSAVLGMVISRRLYQKKRERERKLVDWTLEEFLILIRWDQEEGTMSLMRTEPLNGRNYRLTEEIVCIDTIMDLEKKGFYVTMEGIQIALDGKTILEDEGDGLLLMQEKVWLKIPDSDIVREFFAKAN